MSNADWFDLSFLDSDDNLEQLTQRKEQGKKRKWREIESIKEKRRLRKELAEYEQYLI